MIDQLDTIVSLSQTVSKCADSIESTLVQARKSFSETKEYFIDEGYKILGQTISEYSVLFDRTKCKTRGELESLWSDNFSNIDVREAVEELLKVEEKWDQFLIDVDNSAHHLKNNKQKERDNYPLSLNSNVNEILRPISLTQVKDNADDNENIEELGDILSRNTNGYH